MPSADIQASTRLTSRLQRVFNRLSRSRMNELVGPKKDSRPSWGRMRVLRHSSVN